MKTIRDLLLEERFGVKGILTILINSFYFTKEEANDLMDVYSHFHNALLKKIIAKENKGEYK